MEKLAIHGGAPVRDKKLYYGHQCIDEEDIKAVVNVLRGDYLTCGPKIAEIEARFCKVTHAKHAVVVSNGTAALHIACMAAGVGPGDEVITTPITFAASANCAVYCGATPVFADINPETYNIDPDSIRAHITPKTKAVVAVDFTGQAVEIEKIRGVKCEHAINRLIEYNLIREVGRLDAPGRPILFGTTEEFLRHFGTGSLDELPAISPVKVEDFKAEAEEEARVQLGI